MAYLTCSEGGSIELHLLGGTHHCTIVILRAPILSTWREIDELLGAESC